MQNEGVGVVIEAGFYKQNESPSKNISEGSSCSQENRDGSSSGQSIDGSKSKWRSGRRFKRKAGMTVLLS